MGPPNDLLSCAVDPEEGGGGHLGAELPEAALTRETRRREGGKRTTSRTHPTPHPQFRPWHIGTIATPGDQHESAGGSRPAVARSTPGTNTSRGGSRPAVARTTPGTNTSRGDRGPRWHARRRGTNTSRGGSRPAVARTTPGDHRAVGTFATSGDDCDARANRDVGDPRDAIGYRHVGDARDAGRRSPSVPDWTAGGTSCEPARAGSRARGVGPRVPGRQERRRGALSRTAQSACRRRSRSPSGGCTRRRRRPRPRPRTRGRRCKARAARRGERSGRATRHREPGR